MYVESVDAFCYRLTSFDELNMTLTADGDSTRPRNYPLNVVCGTTGHRARTQGANVVNRARRIILSAIAVLCFTGGYAFAIPLPITSTTANAPGVLINGTTVSLYIPYSSDDSLRFRAALKVIEAAPSATIPKTVVLKTGFVNECAPDPSTGIALCSGDFGSSYTIAGATNTVTGFRSGATKLIHFTGGDCANCGVAIDDDLGGVPTAILSTSKGYLPVGLSPFKVNSFFSTADDVISGQFGYDPINHRILSPNYTITSIRNFKSQNPDYQIIDATTGTAFDLSDKTDFFNNNGTCTTNSGGTTQRDALPDSGAYDIVTRIAYGTFRSPADCTGANTVTDVALFDLTQAAFGSTTWSDTGKQIQTLAEMGNLTNGITGIAIPPALHMAIVADRHEKFGGSTGFGALSLPTTSGSGVPAVQDWVQATMPNDPSKRVWQMSNEPNGLTAYVSPNNAKGYGVILNRTRTYAAIVDIAALLAATRSGAHTISSSTDLITPGIVRFVDIRPGH